MSQVSSPELSRVSTITKVSSSEKDDAAKLSSDLSVDGTTKELDAEITKGKSVEQLDSDDWDKDPDNARNWTPTRKWLAVSIVSIYTFIPPFASSMMAPGLPDVAAKYHITNPTVVALTFSIFLVSYGFAPLLLAPLSEIYGRTWVLHICNIFSMGFNLGCAFSPNTGALVAFRFLSGFTGGVPVAIGGGTVGDLFSERERASAMAIYTLMPLIAPAIGSVAGGFISQTIGIRYVFVVIAALCGVTSVFGVILLRETYAPVIQIRKLKKEASDPEKAAKLERLQENNKNIIKVLAGNLLRPIVLLTRSFICFILSLYLAFLYGIYYLMFSTFGDFFHNTYGFKEGVGGLTYLGLSIGFVLAALVGTKPTDLMYKRLADKNGGKGKPEMRIPALFFGSFFVPVGVFWYGWSAQAKLHWIMPIIGTGIFGFGMMTSYLPIQLYLVDAFKYAASASAASSLFRSLLGFAFPLFGDQMFRTLGLGGGNSLLAGLAIILGIPFPIWIYYKGEAMRARSSLTK
ncbi:hypothetical protein AX15_003601 [Amanita polypyramis BW_CC]|nr:hypothetical protein AX15_003601 [Amanita polypyramis BW_CC]